ncbi:unnamed protein product [Gadus morhua 'NCC']
MVLALSFSTANWPASSGGGGQWYCLVVGSGTAWWWAVVLPGVVVVVVLPSGGQWYCLVVVSAEDRRRTHGSFMSFLVSYRVSSCPTGCFHMTEGHVLETGG